MDMGRIEIDLLPGSCELDRIGTDGLSVSALVLHGIDAVEDSVIVRHIVGVSVAIYVTHLDRRGNFGLAE